ncbi:MAG: hypothetical protein ABIM96_02255 [Candidatus Saccharimonas sp.]
MSAEVRDGTPTSLTITTDIEGKIVTQPTVTIEGSVHNVTQIVVYVDGTYSTSLPLASGASSFTIAFGVTPGTHEVRISGLDAYTTSEVIQTIHFTYDPAATPPATGGTGTDTPVNTYIGQTIDAAKAAQADAAQEVQKASSLGPLSTLSDMVFTALKSIDMVSETDGSGINKMIGRFALVSAGLTAVMFPLGVYLLIERIRFVPTLALSSGVVTFGMRAIGIGIILVPFIIIH